MDFNKKLMLEQAYAQRYGDAPPKEKKRRASGEKKEIWEARQDGQEIRLQDAEQAKMKKKNAKEKRKDRIHSDASGVKRFSLDEEERFGKNEP